jgi:hypothetical protein
MSLAPNAIERYSLSPYFYKTSSCSMVIMSGLLNFVWRRARVRSFLFLLLSDKYYLATTAQVVPLVLSERSAQPLINLLTVLLMTL